MDLVQAITALETDHAAVMSARPTAAGDGVDITGMKIGGFSHTTLSGYLKANGANVTLGPIAASDGVEVWIQKADKAGTLLWWLEGVINGGNICRIVGTGGFRFPLVISGDGARLAIVGLSSDVTKIPTFYVEPVEHINDKIS